MERCMQFHLVFRTLAICTAPVEMYLKENCYFLKLFSQINSSRILKRVRAKMCPPELVYSVWTALHPACWG